MIEQSGRYSDASLTFIESAGCEGVYECRGCGCCGWDWEGWSDVP